MPELKNLHVDLVDTSEAFVNVQESKDSTAQAAKPKVDQNLQNDHHSVKPPNHSWLKMIFNMLITNYMGILISFLVVIDFYVHLHVC